MAQLSRSNAGRRPVGEVNPSRLILARKLRGLTKRELAARAEVSIRSLDNYESGEHEPSETNLSQLAEVLDFPAEFFDGPDIDVPAVEVTSFRAVSGLPARRVQQANASAAMAQLLVRWIDDRFELPQPEIPRYPGVKAEVAAEALRKRWGLGEKPAPNMVHLLEAHGMRVFALIEDCRLVDAFSLWQGDRPYIFLNTTKSAERSRMDAAHELGHLVLHGGHSASGGREPELEAQRFGAAFLMPRRSLLAMAPRGGDLSRIIRAKHYWNVAVANLAYRMHEVNLLTDWQYRTLFIQISSAGYRISEPEGSRGETSQLLAKVFESLRAGGVTKADVAKELRINIDDLNKLTFGLMLTPVEGNGNTGQHAKQKDRPKLKIMS
jgi:Zn-dependent peptidase ImmA (M78 family)/DNA-binding XRE family transcriptional regulator